MLQTLKAISCTDKYISTMLQTQLVLPVLVYLQWNVMEIANHNSKVNHVGL